MDRRKYSRYGSVLLSGFAGSHLGSWKVCPRDKGDYRKSVGSIEYMYSGVPTSIPLYLSAWSLKSSECPSSRLVWPCVTAKRGRDSTPLPTCQYDRILENLRAGSLLGSTSEISLWKQLVDSSQVGYDNLPPDWIHIPGQWPLPVFGTAYSLWVQ